MAGWKRTKAAQVFGPDNLWEAIDGAAETYETFEFQELVTVPCKTADGRAEATVEVYRLADALNAFGIYAQERNASARFLAVGNEGYAVANVLNFWSGPFYVKLTAADEQDARTLPDLANAISQGMGRPAPWPIARPQLPIAGQVPHTVKYVPRDVLGQTYLADALEAEYAGPSGNWRLVVASSRTPAEAEDVFARYRKSLASSAPTRAVRSAGDAAFAGTDRSNRNVVAARSGQRIAITLGAPSEASASVLIREALASR